jgi:hypothetical protein
MSTTKIFNGYWMGYQPDGNTLGEIPAYVNKVTLFVAAPAPDGKSLGVNYLCKDYPQDEQIAWIRQLQAQGTEVLMSIMDTKDTHWNNVDIPAFVRNFKEVAIDGPWGLNGVDIDLESGMPSGVWADTFTSLITEFRKVLGPKGTLNSGGQCISRISVAGYVPSGEVPVLQAAGNDLDWLNTMAYGNDASGNEKLFDTYSAWVEQVNIGIGVYYQGGASTDLRQTELMAEFAAATANCGMMEFGMNNDCEHYIDKPQWTYASAIAKRLSPLLKAC